MGDLNFGGGDFSGGFGGDFGGPKLSGVTPGVDMSQLPPEDESSTLWKMLRIPVQALSYGLQALDLPRRVLWSLAEKGSSELGSALGTRKDRPHTWGESWDNVRFGSEWLKNHYPEWSEQNETLSWFTGLGMEIAGDPLNLVGLPAGFTKVGRALSKGTMRGLQEAASFGHKPAMESIARIGAMAQSPSDYMRAAAEASSKLLGVNWLAQTEKGNRVLLRLGNRTLIKGEKAVKGLGEIGRVIGENIGKIWGGSLLSRTMSSTIIDAQNMARQGSAELGEQLLKVQDELSDNLGRAVDDILKAPPVGSNYRGNHAAVHDAIGRAAEMYKRPGFIKQFDQLDPRIQQAAEYYSERMTDFWRIAEEAGIARPKRIERAYNKVDRAIGRVNVQVSERSYAVGQVAETVELRNKQLWLPVTAARSARDVAAARLLDVKALESTYRDLYDSGLRLLEDAYKESAHTQPLRGKVADAATNLQRAKATVQKVITASTENKKLITQADHTVGKAKQLAQVAESKAIAERAAVYEAAITKIDALRESVKKVKETSEKTINKIKLAQKLQDEMPAQVVRALTPFGRATVDKLIKRTGTTRLWNSEYLNSFEAAMAMITPKSALATSPLTSANIEGILNIALEKSKLGKKSLTNAAELGRAATPMVNRIKSLVGRTKSKPIDLTRLVNPDLNTGFDKMTRAVLNDFEIGNMAEALLKAEGDHISKIRLPGYVPVSEISSPLAKRMGNVFVSPELQSEMRRMYTHAMMPDHASSIVRGIDKVHSIFKLSVISPESFPLIGRHLGGAMVGATVGGVTTGEWSGAIGGAGAGFLGSVALSKAGGWLGSMKIPGWPAYHARNFTSDFVLMGYNGKFNPARVLSDGFKGIRKKGLVDLGEGVKISGAKLSRLARAHGVTFGEIADATGQHAMAGQMENMRRMGYFADRMREGYSPFHAAQETKKVLFDYAEMSEFERTYMKRIIPFWSWLRSSVRRNAIQLMDKPAIVKHQMRAVQQSSDIEGIPEWYRGRMVAQLSPDTQTGEERFLTGIGLPIDSFAELLDYEGGFKSWVRSMTFSMSPIIKAGLGVGGVATESPATGFWDEAAGRRRWPAKVGGSLDDPAIPGITTLTEAAREWLDARRVSRDRKMPNGTTKHESYWTIDADKAWVLQQIGTRFYSTIVAATDPRKSGENRLISYLTGARVVHVDPANTKYWEEKNRKQQLLNRSIRRGDVATGQYVYGKNSDVDRNLIRYLNERDK